MLGLAPTLNEGTWYTSRPGIGCVTPQLLTLNPSVRSALSSDVMRTGSLADQFLSPFGVWWDPDGFRLGCLQEPQCQSLPLEASQLSPRCPGAEHAGWHAGWRPAAAGRKLGDGLPSQCPFTPNLLECHVTS